MSAGVGQAKLVESSRKFLVAWQRARESWRDIAATRVQTEVIDDLPSRLQAAASAMSQIGDLVRDAQRDCS